MRWRGFGIVTAAVAMACSTPAARQGEGGAVVHVGVLGGSGGDVAQEVAAVGDDFALAMSFRGDLVLGDGRFAPRELVDTAAARVTASGEVVWSVAMAADRFDSGVPVVGGATVAVAADAEEIAFDDGSSLALDEPAALVAFTTDGDLVWAAPAATSWLGDASALAVGDDGAIVAAGQQSPPPAAASPFNSYVPSTMYLSRVRADGSMAWEHSVGTDETRTAAAGVAVDLDGTIVVGGSFEDEVNFGDGVTLPAPDATSTDPEPTAFVARFDSDGRALWARQVSRGRGTVKDLAVATDGAIYVLGVLDTSGIGDRRRCYAPDGNEAMLVRLSSDGEPEWAHCLGMYAGDWAVALAVDAQGRAAVTGYIDSVVDLGGGPIEAPGRAGFVAQYDAGGDHLWSLAFAGDGGTYPSSIAANARGQLAVVGSTTDGLRVDDTSVPGAGDQDAFLLVLDP